MKMDRRQRLVEIFQDTVRWYTEDPDLIAASRMSYQLTRLYQPDEYPDLPDNPQKTCQVIVSPQRTFEAAAHAKAKNPSSRIAVLNFASAVKPGGGVVHGSSAQEECLCRCSTLYYALDNKMLWANYYNVNRAAQNVLHTDACIYSPSIVVFKTDDSFPERMPKEQWFIVDVISCAAPNLRQTPGNPYNPEGGDHVLLSPEEQYHLHLKRAMHIFHVAASKSVDTLILGAVGCGAFYNNPWAVARAYDKALEAYSCYFDLVEFAVYCNPYDQENYQAFMNTIHQHK